MARPPPAPVPAPDVVLVHVWENQIRGLGGGWTADEARPWSLATTGAACLPPEEFELPKEGEVYCWSGNWKLEKRCSVSPPGVVAAAATAGGGGGGEAGAGVDREGWTYASRYSRFGEPERSPKPEARWNDGARRRLWTRTMRKEFSKGSGVARELQMADMSRIIPRMQHGLEKVNEARKKIEMIMKQAPQAAQSEQMLANILSVRKTIADITSILEQLERAQGPGSAHIASIKKLRRELTKEEIAIERALYGGNGGNGGGGGGGGSQKAFPPLSRTGSGGSISSRDSSFARPGVDGSSSGKFPGGGSSLSSSSSSVKGGSQGAFHPSLLTHSGSSGNGLGPGGDDASNVSLSLDDGSFVEQSTHDRLISQKLLPVDEAAVMQDLIEERGEEISRVHKGIVEINAMFVDLSRIVGEQGLLIESIWSNVDEGNATTRDAFKNIVQADRAQRGGNCAVM